MLFSQPPEPMNDADILGIIGLPQKEVRPMIRRQLLLSATYAVPLALLAACAGQSAATITGQVVQDVNLIANGLEADLPALQAALGTNFGAANAVIDQVKAIVAAAAGFVTGISQSQGKSIVLQIGADYSALMQALGPFMALLPPLVVEALTAAGILLPLIEIAIGMIPTATAAAKAGAMTPAQARAVLTWAAQQ